MKINELIYALDGIACGAESEKLIDLAVEYLKKQQKDIEVLREFINKHKYAKEFEVWKFNEWKRIYGK